MNQFELRDLITIHNGKDHKSLRDGDIPVYGSGGIMRYVDECLYNGEVILLPRIWCVDTTYWATAKNENVNLKYLFCYLSLLDLSARDSGSTLPSMTFESYYSLVISLPDVETQKKVADFIFDLQAKTENNNKIISELESLAKTIYDYWFLQFEFPNEDGKPYKSSGGKMIWNEELKREIPEGWTFKTLNQVAKRINVGFVGSIDKYYCNDKDGVQIIRPAEMSKYGINFSALKHVTSEFHNKNKKSQLHFGDVLISRCGKDGIPNIYDSNDEGQVLNAVIIEPDNDKASSSFIVECLKSDYSQIQIKNSTSGSVQGVINTEKISQIKLPYSKYICKRFTRISDVLYEYINIARKENYKLKDTRDFLLPMLMNGQVTFKD